MPGARAREGQVEGCTSQVLGVRAGRQCVGKATRRLGGHGRSLQRGVALRDHRRPGVNGLRALLALGRRRGAATGAVGVAEHGVDGLRAGRAVQALHRLRPRSVQRLRGLRGRGVDGLWAAVRHRGGGRAGGRTAAFR